MLTISEAVMAKFHDNGLRTLRAQILSHWFMNLRRSGDDAGEAGRASVLADIEALSREDPSLTVADLRMLADLKLVEAARVARAQQTVRR